MYLYVAADHWHIPGKSDTKVGVSQNPRRRVQNIQNHGQFILKKKWLMPSRAAALALESFVCDSFTAYKGREWLSDYCDDVIDFIDRHVERFGGCANG